MGSSAKTGKKIFRGSQEQFLDKTGIWDRTPPSYTSTAVHMHGGAQGLQIFKQNSIISIRSKVMAFLVISLSPWSLWSPHHAHIIPVVPMLSPHHSHIPQKVRMWSPWLWSLWSPWSPPYVVPVISMPSPHCLEGPHIIPNAPDTHSTHPLPLGGGGP